MIAIFHSIRLSIESNERQSNIGEIDKKKYHISQIICCPVMQKDMIQLDCRS